MKIKLVCFSHLLVHWSGEELLEVPGGACAGDIPGILGFSRDDVAMYFIGENRVDADCVLSEGDVLKLFPQITGG